MNGSDLKAKFDSEWGAFRKFIAAHPLTGFWVGVGVGVAASFATKLLGFTFGL
jgi:hypothetical protein